MHPDHPAVDDAGRLRTGQRQAINLILPKEAAAYLRDVQAP